jgi:glycosyltransferase involved in cell wall biosynthesis
VRIAVVSSFPPTIGGIPDYAGHMTEHLAADPRVEAVTVLADRVPRAGAIDRIGEVDVRRVWQRDRIATGPELLRALRAVRPDVVWFNLGLTMFGTRPLAAAGGLLTPIVTTLLGYRTVVTLHELPALADLRGLGLRSPHGQIAGALVPRLLLSANTVIVTLERYRHYLVARYGARNVRRIPLGPHGQPEFVDEPKEPAVLVFGTFGPHKEPGLVAEGIARLRRSRPSLRLIVAGSDHPRYPGFMAECCARYGLDAEWVGYVPPERLAALFARATVVVVPARASTGASGVIYRAIGHARAVLASDLPDFRGLAQDEDIKLEWFAPGDADGLAGALDALLGDRDHRHHLVRHNLRTVERLKPARIVDAYVHAFAGSQPSSPASEAARAAAFGGLVPALSSGLEA